jgi:hypothetical protein
VDRMENNAKLENKTLERSADLDAPQNKLSNA